MAFNVSGEINVLSEIKQCEDVHEFSSGCAGGFFNMEVEVAEQCNGWGYGEEVGDEFRQVGEKGGVWLGGSVNNCNDQGFRAR